MTDLRTAAQQALEALAVVINDDYNLPYSKIVAAAEALRAALAEPVQEPVAWRYKTNLPGARWEVSTMSPAEAREWNVIVEEQPLYTHPPQRKPFAEPVPKVLPRKLPEDDDA